MSSFLAHSDVEGLLAPFALDAVDAYERATVAAHLLSCASCQDEVAEYRDAVIMLSLCGIARTGRDWDG